MNDAATAGEIPVEPKMGGGVAGGLPFPLHHPAFRVHHHHVLRMHGLIAEAGGLDDREPRLPVDAGDVAPGEGDEPVLRQQQVGLADDLFQLFQHGRLLRKSLPPSLPRGRRGHSSPGSGGSPPVPPPWP